MNYGGTDEQRTHKKPEAPVIREIDMIFRTPIELRCILNRERWDGLPSELKI